MADDIEEDEEPYLTLNDVYELVAAAILIARGRIPQPPEETIWADWAKQNVSDTEFAQVRSEAEVMTPDERGGYCRRAGFEDFDA